MILITHAIVGSALSRFSDSITGAFFIGLGSHYILDAIPHYDYVDSSFTDDPYSKSSKKALWRIMLDGAIGVVVPILIFWPGNIADFLKIFLAVCGAMLPDALQGVNLYFPNPVTAIHKKFHNAMHFLITDKPYLMPYPKLGLFLQAIISVLFIVLSR